MDGLIIGVLCPPFSHYDVLQTVLRRRILILDRLRTTASNAAVAPAAAAQYNW